MYTVASSVMRNISHFLRWDANESEASYDDGGWMIANAEESRECVCAKSRWRNARAARLYSERRVAAVLVGVGCSTLLALREIIAEEMEVAVVVVSVVAVGISEQRVVESKEQ
jgi:hypothetical protein